MFVSAQRLWEQLGKQEALRTARFRGRRGLGAGQHGRLLVALMFIVSTINCGGSGSSVGQSPPPSGTWTLTWSDEFDGLDGSAPDSTKWTYDIGGSGWGNNELECYTNLAQNAVIQGGNLVITVLHQPGFACGTTTNDYTSARLKTQGLFSQAYGRFEARIKIPYGQGMWPAFWMLGDNIETAGWPACGEIDVMENIGSEPSTVHGSMNGPGYSGGSALTSSYTLPSGHFSDDYHVFAVEWEPNVANFYVDDALYETRTPSDLPAGASWVFDHPFFIVLNVAVGGNWPGNPDQTAVFPQTMQVDYVRVYTRQ